jgi:nicotinate phosphoribosyltransferase
MPDNCVFLVDTYGTISGIQNAIAAARTLREQGHEAIGIRLDSGDLAYFSKQARAMLDEAGFPEARIMASNELDEYVITSLKNQGAAITHWGVGTKLVTAYDDPALSGVYKLSAIQDEQGQWQHKMKLSEQKIKMTIPGLLQVQRCYDNDDKMIADAITLRDEQSNAIGQIIDPNDNLHRKHLRRVVRREALLQPCCQAGQTLLGKTDLAAVQARVKAQLATLDDSHKRFEYPHIYPVGLSPQLNRLRDDMIQRERERLVDRS